MSELEKLEEELKGLIIDALELEDIAPCDINAAEPLFVEGLGLDSIDALEIAMVLEQQYGVVTKDDDEELQKTYSSIRSLAAFVAEQRVK